VRAGDLVRFRQCTWHVEPKKYTDWQVGLLLEYKTWKKVAYILYDGETVSVPARDVQLHKRANRKVICDRPG